jgi:hypothetical protein
MATRRIPLNDATHDQLLQYGQTVLGLPFAPVWKIETMIAKILEARPGLDFIEIEMDDAPAAQANPSAPPDIPAELKAAAVPSGDDWVTIRLGADPGKGGDRDKDVGVNGQIMMIPRGKDVAIPRSYYMALLNTEQLIYETDKNGNLLHPPRKVQRFNIAHIQDGIKPGVPVARTIKKQSAQPVAAA